MTSENAAAVNDERRRGVTDATFGGAFELFVRRASAAAVVAGCWADFLEPAGSCFFVVVATAESDEGSLTEIWFEQDPAEDDDDDDEDESGGANVVAPGAALGERMKDEGDGASEEVRLVIGGCMVEKNEEDVEVLHNRILLVDVEKKNVQVLKRNMI